MALFRKLATRIVWTLDARPFRQRSVYLFSMRLFNIEGRGSQVLRNEANLKEHCGTAFRESLNQIAIRIAPG